MKSFDRMKENVFDISRDINFAMIYIYIYNDQKLVGCSFISSNKTK